MAIHPRRHQPAKWEPIGSTGRIRVGVYPDGTARLSIRPTREFPKLSAQANRNPWVAFHDGEPEECREMGEKLETVMLHASLYADSRRVPGEQPKQGG